MAGSGQWLRRKRDSGPLRFAMFGAGFWAQYQLHGWQEIPGAKCVALYNRTLSTAQKAAKELGIPAVYADPEEMLKNEDLDFVDVVTAPQTHKDFVLLAAQCGLPVICQKPMAPSMKDVKAMVSACRKARVPYFIHENWRWQTAIRRLKQTLDTGCIGAPFRARISHFSGFPVFQYEPNLKEWENYILYDMGPHLLDVTRFFFGEAKGLYCRTYKFHKDIKGEDVATVMLDMQGKTTVTIEMGYPSTHYENDMFPETHLFIEGEKGTLELGREYRVRLTTKGGTRVKQWLSPHYDWADPHYDAYHASIVACNRHMLAAMKGLTKCETAGEDNMRTLELVFACYQSAQGGKAVSIGD